MSLPWPRTLFARLMLIWLVGIAAVLAISYGLFLGERDRFDRDVLFEGLAREIAAAADVLDRLSPDERAQWIEALGRRRLRLALAPPPPEARALPEHLALVQALRRAQPDRDVSLHILDVRPGERGPHGRLLASIRLSDASPLTVRLPVPQTFTARTPLPPERVLAALLALIAGVTLLAWIAVRIATRPLSRLAEAARALGEDPNRPALETHGPTEVALAASAFNQMQQRIREHVGERTRILAAISHDLQTPITRLRLRAEQIDDESLRGQVQSDLDAMQALVTEGLDYARSLDAPAELQPVDLNALVHSVCEDAREMGWQVTLEGGVKSPCITRPVALQRALWNLIENGVKFGRTVAVSLDETPTAHLIRIRDHGAGLPESELEMVFEPFYRTEASRSRETGGTGLGLAIARNLLRAQGAEVRLRNMDGGGLEAVVELPRVPQSTRRRAA
ncbi:MAG TPA: ATP-binding protein [Rhodocyclaceae bacterium]|nr:ATP-binding protein [Rhodocyclaceae bacterium]